MITKRLALWILYVICRALKLVSWAILIYSTLPQFIKTCWSAHVIYCSIFILCFLITFKVRLFTQEELDAAVKKETEALRKQVTFAPLSVLRSCLAQRIYTTSSVSEAHGDIYVDILWIKLEVIAVSESQRIYPRGSQKETCKKPNLWRREFVCILT